jgi:hypothetical protein
MAEVWDQFSVISVPFCKETFFGSRKIAFVYLPIASRSGTIQLTQERKRTNRPETT